MKRIYMTLALVAGLGVTAMAQTAKNVDLQIEWVAPMGHQANLSSTDTLPISFAIKNLGTDPVDSTDTLTFVIGTHIFGSAIYNYLHLVTVGGPQHGINIPVGKTDTLTWRVPNGIKLFSNSNATISVPTDATVCTKIAVFGYSSSLMFFNDPGFDPATYNQIVQNAQTAADYNQLWTAFSGNNLADTATVIYGTGVTNACDTTNGINNVKAGTIGLNVYPNPVSDNNINLDFTIDHNSANTEIRVNDMTGRTVLVQNIGNIAAGDHSVRINVSSLTAGNYFIQLNAAGMHGVAKFTINK